MKYIFIFLLIVFPYLFGFLWGKIDDISGNTDPYEEEYSGPDDDLEAFIPPLKNIPSE
mgnify:CR=1 FL=1